MLYLDNFNIIPLI